MIGQKLAHYTVLDRLGAGGMGEVYLARDDRLGREVALKILPKEFSADEKRVARFHREAKLASALSHTNIATIYEAGTVRGLHFIAMELVRGKTLTEYMKAGGVSMKALLNVAIPLAEGLAEAHEVGVVHRDLKPGNVMVDEKGRVKILDFGLSRPLPDSDLESSQLTSSGKIMGTPQYMAPEQMRGEETDARSDLFSLGVILYELATGARPFEGGSPAVVMKSVLASEPTPLVQARPILGELFGHTVDRLLQKDADQRFQSAAGVAAELRSLRGPTTVVPAKPNRMPLLITGAALVAVVIGLVYALGPKPDRETAASEVVVPAPMLESGRLKLALIQVHSPPGDETASVLARMLTVGLAQTLDIPDLDLISPSYLRGKANYLGVKGDLDAFTATEIAEEEGATVIVIGKIEPGLDGLDLHCELLEEGTTRRTESIVALTSALVPTCVSELATAILVELGLDPPVAGVDYSSLTASSKAFDLWSKGMTAFDLWALTEADFYFRAAIEVDPDFTLAYYHRAFTLWWDEKPREGEEVLKPVLGSLENLSNVDREKVLLLTELLRGAPDSGGGSAPDAPGLVARARALALTNPRDKDALDLWMEFAVHHTTEGRAQEAARAVEALIALDPDHGPACFHWGTPFHAGRWDLVEKTAEFYRSSGSDHPFAPIAALILGERDEARSLAKAQGLDPRSVEGSVLALQAAFALDDLQLAYEIAQVGQRRYPRPFGGLVSSLISQGRFLEGRNLASRTNTTEPLRLDLGVALDGARAFDRMRPLHEVIRAARSGDPDGAEQAMPPPADNPLLRRLHALALGEIAYARGRDDVALERFLEAAPAEGEIENEQVSRWSGLLIQRAGRALREAGQFDEAELWLRRFEKEPESWALFSHHSMLPRIRAYWDLALCRDALDDPDGALEYLVKFLDHWHEPDPSFPEIVDALEMYRGLTGEPYSR